MNIISGSVRTITRNDFAYGAASVASNARKTNLYLHVSPFSIISYCGQGRLCFHQSIRGGEPAGAKTPLADETPLGERSSGERSSSEKSLRGHGAYGGTELGLFPIIMPGSTSEIILRIILFSYLA